MPGARSWIRAQLACIRSRVPFSSSSSKPAVDEAGVQIRAAERQTVQQGSQEAGIGFDRVYPALLIDRPHQTINGVRTRERGMGDDLGDHRVVEHGHFIAALDRTVDADHPRPPDALPR